MKIIGLTGGVGSGKSTVAKLMEKYYGAHLLIADDIARDFMKKDEISYNLIVNHFGTAVLDENKELNRKKLAEIVFAKEEQLKILNSFIHPYVKDYILKEIDCLYRNDSNAIIIVESAILFEVSYQEFCDEIWYVNALKEIRRERLKLGRGYSDEKIDSILSNQLSEDEYMKQSHHVIYNNDNEDKLKAKLEILLVNKESL